MCQVEVGVAQLTGVDGHGIYADLLTRSTYLPLTTTSPKCCVRFNAVVSGL